MSVLDAFIHDPLVEWEDEKRRMVGKPFILDSHILNRWIGAGTIATKSSQGFG